MLKTDFRRVLSKCSIAIGDSDRHRMVDLKTTTSRINYGIGSLVNYTKLSLSLSLYARISGGRRNLKYPTDFELGCHASYNVKGIMESHRLESS
jgi:hypothetical protein